MAKAKKKASKQAGKTDEPAKAKTRSIPPGRVGIENKLSTKMIVGIVKFPDDAEDGHELDLFTAYGEAVAIKEGESTYGPWQALVGKFRAIRASDGKIFQSQKIFLPTVATELAVDTIRKLEKKAEAARAAGHPELSAAVEFVIKVGARKDSSIQAGYRYICEPLLNEQSDLFARLEHTAMLALPNPDK